MGISAHDARSVWISAPAASFVARGDGDEILGAYYIKPNQPEAFRHARLGLVDALVMYKTLE